MFHYYMRNGINNFMEKIEIKIKNEFLNTKQNFSVPSQKLESLGDILFFYNKIRTYVLESNNFNL